MTHYTIRYRCSDLQDRIALIVDNGRGDAYLFSDGRLQVRLAGNDACARLARLLGRYGTCASVPAVTPYTLDGLRRCAAPVA